ncbi:hypothetical protein ACJMK2_015307, partial [Sinanodonta woodiana]
MTSLPSSSDTIQCMVNSHQTPFSAWSTLIRHHSVHGQLSSDTIQCMVNSHQTPFSA